MNIDEDTSAWLGCPTPLEMYKHHCSLLEDELTQTQVMLRQARANIAGLVQLCDELTTGKAFAEGALKKARSEVSRLNRENSEMDRKVNGLLIVADQRDHLFRENQRLLMELKTIGFADSPAHTESRTNQNAVAREAICTKPNKI